MSKTNIFTKGINIPSMHNIADIDYIFETSETPTIRLSDIRARRFYLVDRVAANARAFIQNEEDTDIFRALINASNARSGTQTDTGVLTSAALNNAFRIIEEHGENHLSPLESQVVSENACSQSDLSKKPILLTRRFFNLEIL